MSKPQRGSTTTIIIGDKEKEILNRIRRTKSASKFIREAIRSKDGPEDILVIALRAEIQDLKNDISELKKDRRTLKTNLERAKLKIKRKKEEAIQAEKDILEDIEIKKGDIGHDVYVDFKAHMMRKFEKREEEARREFEGESKEEDNDEDIYNMYI